MGIGSLPGFGKIRLVHFLEELLLLFTVLSGTARFATRVPSWKLPSLEHVAALATPDDESDAAPVQIDEDGFVDFPCVWRRGFWAE